MEVRGLILGLRSRGTHDHRPSQPNFTDHWPMQPMIV